MRTYNCLNCGKEQKYKGVNYANKYCDNTCSAQHRHLEWFKKNESLFCAGKLKSRSSIKRFVKLRDGNNCSICGQTPVHNSKPLTMILDHIDGNATNNVPSNFRLVCPNCDTQLPTYKSKNYGNGRASRGLPKYSRL